MPSRTRIDLFYDILSPYSWFAFEALSRYQTVWNIELNLRPYLIAAVMKATGNQSPIVNPKKGAYSNKDLQLLGEYYGIPIRQLEDPINALFNEGSLNCQRFLTVLKAQKPNLLESVTRELWIRRWSKDMPIKSSNEDFLPILEKFNCKGAEAQKILEKINHEETKKELTACTQEALDNGAFGAPWIHVYKDGKIYPFWGSDRFHVIAWLIGEEWQGPLKEKSAKL